MIKPPTHIHRKSSTLIPTIGANVGAIGGATREIKLRIAIIAPEAKNSSFGFIIQQQSYFYINTIQNEPTLDTEKILR
jgi:hypothetical protein